MLKRTGWTPYTSLKQKQSMGPNFLKWQVLVINAIRKIIFLNYIFILQKKNSIKLIFYLLFFLIKMIRKMLICLYT